MASSGKQTATLEEQDSPKVERKLVIWSSGESVLIVSEVFIL